MCSVAWAWTDGITAGDLKIAMRIRSPALLCTAWQPQQARAGETMGIDARGQKEVDVKSTQQLWGALVPNLVLAVVYVSAFLYFRRGFRDVYDPKRRRLRVLEQGRDHPTVRGLPEAWKDRPPGLTPSPLPPPDVPANPGEWTAVASVAV